MLREADMKSQYFEKHPFKNYLWRLNGLARKKYGDLLNCQGFCAHEYYTKELSDLMLKHIEDAEKTQATNVYDFSQNKIVYLDSYAIQRMIRARNAGRLAEYEKIKRHFLHVNK